MRAMVVSYSVKNLGTTLSKLLIKYYRGFHIFIEAEPPLLFERLLKPYPVPYHSDNLALLQQ